jgi:hypothetical protein
LSDVDEGRGVHHRDTEDTEQRQRRESWGGFDLMKTVIG